jgi:hypothetical protein
MLKVFQDINMAMETTGEFGDASKVGGSKGNLLKMVRCPPLAPALPLKDHRRMRRLLTQGL